MIIQVEFQGVLQELQTSPEPSATIKLNTQPAIIVKYGIQQ